ncbi:MAG: GNAT family N-acetyltransferase [Chloroflexi bacterium]|nr:GNAT family N-acetyltransferase [Chloroflexota bacterium]
MERVNDLKHFSALVKETKAASGNLISNCYLLPAHIQRYTHQKKMFYASMETGICFLCDEGDFYNLYFYLAEQAEVGFGKPDKPVIINLIHRDSSKPGVLCAIEDKWVGGGFTRYKSYKRMSLTAGFVDSEPFNPQIPDSMDYTKAFARCSHLDEITALWRSTLDIYSDALPSGDEMINYLEKKQILCVLDKGQHIAAALQFQPENKVCIIRHVAVDEKHRRRGLAKILMNFCFSECININRYILWVETNNLPAIKLYLYFGFQFDGVVSSQLLQKLQDNHIQI